MENISSETLIAFKKLQREMSGIIKSKSVAFKSVNYKHAELNDILNMLDSKMGDDWICIPRPAVKENKNILQTVFVYIPTGEKISGEIEIISSSNDQKVVGASMTYYRRYILQCLLNLKVYDSEEDMLRSEGFIDECLINAVNSSENVNQIISIFNRETKKLTMSQINTLTKLCADKRNELMEGSK